LEERIVSEGIGGLSVCCTCIVKKTFVSSVDQILHSNIKVGDAPGFSEGRETACVCRTYTSDATVDIFFSSFVRSLDTVMCV